MAITWKTLKEIEKEYKISASTLRVLIHQEKIGNYYIKKEGKTWYLNETWVKQNYEKRK